MKKILGLLIGAVLVVAGLSPAYAGVTSNTMEPIVVNWNANAVTLYIVGGATTSAASYQVFADSIALTTAGGLYPGTTHLVFSDANKNTLEELVDYINSIPATTVGVEGGAVAAIVNGAYDKNPSEELTAGNSTACLGSSNIKTLAMDRTLGISYTIPSSRQYRNYQYHVTGLNVNATYTSGSVFLDIYDGSEYTDTNLFQYKANATTVETPIILPSNGDLAGGENKAMRFDLIGSSWVTSGHIGIIGHRK